MDSAKTSSQVSMADTKPDFAQIYDSYFSRVYNYVRYRVRNPETADDITSRIFERVLDNFKNYQPGRAPFPVWLFTIARNAVNDHFRARKWRFWSLESTNEEIGYDPKPDDIMIKKENQNRLLDAVSRLDDREKDIIALKFVLTMTNRQIAGITGLTESNVGVILYRSFNRLKAELKEKL